MSPMFCIITQKWDGVQQAFVRRAQLEIALRRRQDERHNAHGYGAVHVDETT